MTPAEIAELKSHLDTRLKEQDSKRADEFSEVYKLIDEDRKRIATELAATTANKRDLIERYARETNTSIQAMAVQVATEVRLQCQYNDQRIRALETGAAASAERKNNWFISLVTAIVGGVIGFFTSHFGTTPT